MPPTSLIPKFLAAVFFLAAFYQLSTYKSGYHLPQRSPSTPVDQTGSTWFSDAIKAPADLEDEEDALLPEAVPTPSSSPANLRDYNDIHIPYGTTQCMPHFDKKWRKAALARNASCSTSAPFPVQETRRVGFASITTGPAIDAYQRAILSQMFHAAVHDSSIHILCDALTEGTFNKIAFLLHLVMGELLKPASTRLEWIMWIDRDAIILDACRPLSSFLPPQDAAFDNIELIVNNDAGGLNNGIFFFKVSAWMVKYLNHVLAVKYFRPDADFTFAEQSAMDMIMNEEDSKDKFVRVPWYWFNAFPDEEDSTRKYRDNLTPDDLEWFRARKGDFVVHFAGDNGRSGRMPEWEDMVEAIGDVWIGETKRDITKEVEKYWESWKEGTLTTVQREGGEDWDKQDEGDETAAKYGDEGDDEAEDGMRTGEEREMKKKKTDEEDERTAADEDEVDEDVK